MTVSKMSQGAMIRRVPNWAGMGYQNYELVIMNSPKNFTYLDRDQLGLLSNIIKEFFCKSSYG